MYFKMLEFLTKNLKTILLTISAMCFLNAYALMSAPKDKKSSRASTVGWISVAGFILAGSTSIYLIFFMESIDTQGEGSGGSEVNP